MPNHQFTAGYATGNEFDIAEIETVWLSRIKIWGACFTSVFSVMAGWIAEMLFMLFFAYIAVLRRKHS